MNNNNIKQRFINLGIFALCILIYGVLFGVKTSSLLNLNCSSYVKDYVLLIILSISIISCIYRICKNKYYPNIDTFVLVVYGLGLYLFARFNFDLVKMKMFNDFDYLLIGFLSLFFFNAFTDVKLDTLKEQITRNQVRGIKIFNDDVDRDSLGRNRIIDLVFRYLKSEIIRESKSSTNIAIYGNWGIGKSYIKNELIKRLSNVEFYKTFNNRINYKHYYFEYKPWNKANDYSIDIHFFNELKNVLKKQNSDLSRNVLKYFNSIHSANNSELFSYIYGLKDIIFPEISQAELSEYLIQTKTKIFVFIDDVDRLGEDELVELLRFLRNNGDISNIIYVVFMDRKYVEEILGKLAITNFNNYITKYFNLEIDLQKGNIAYRELFNIYLIEPIRFINPSDALQLEGIIRRLDSLRSENFDYLFGNIRNIKSFANRFLFVYHSKNELVREINETISVTDIFVLELLKLFFPDLFNKIKNSSSSDNVIDILNN